MDSDSFEAVPSYQELQVQYLIHSAEPQTLFRGKDE